VPARATHPVVMLNGSAILSDHGHQGVPTKFAGFQERVSHII